VANTKADLLAIGYDYSLSKRTSVYTTLARIDNKDGGTAAQTFSLNGASGRALAVGNGNSTGYEVGIRHNF
jgi:predicted porin